MFFLLDVQKQHIHLRLRKMYCESWRIYGANYEVCDFMRSGHLKLVIFVEAWDATRL